MWKTDRQSLPNWIQDAYELLEPQFENAETGLSREQAEALLLETDEFADKTTDISHALDRLLDRGWLYEVDGQLRKTD